MKIGNNIAEPPLTPNIPARFKAPAIDKFIYIGREFNDGVIRCVLTFGGSLIEERLQKAVRLSFDAEPILGCYFVPRFFRPYWERRTDLNEIDPCPFADTTDLPKAIRQFFKKPLDPCRHPSVQVALFRTDIDTLCLKINHMLADAGGTINYCQLLAKIYCQLGANPEFVPEASIPDQRGQSQLLKSTNPFKLVKGLLHSSLPRGKWGFPALGKDTSSVDFVLNKLSADKFKKIKVYARSNQASVNDVLLTAFYLTLFDFFKLTAKESIAIQHTVNLRRYLPSDLAHPICNVSGIFFPKLKYVPNESFGETLRRVQTIMDKAKRNQPWWGAALYLEFLFIIGFGPLRAAVRLLNKLKLITNALHPFSNIGVIDASTIDFKDAGLTQFEAYGPVSYPPYFLLSLSTFADNLYISTSYSSTAMDTALITEFMDKYLANLPI